MSASHQKSTPIDISANRRALLAARRSVHFSSATCEWETPHALFDELELIFGGFTLDPCATPQNAKCARFFTREDDGLSQPWSGKVFMNPPYGREIGEWVKKAWAESLNGALVVCLLPARVDTRWWHEYARNGHVYFLRGRLKFGALSVAAKKGTSLAVEKKPVVRLRYVRRQGQQIGKERILASLKPFCPHLWFDRRDRTCL